MFSILTNMYYNYYLFSFKLFININCIFGQLIRQTDYIKLLTYLILIILIKYLFYYYAFLYEILINSIKLINKILNSVVLFLFFFIFKWNYYYYDCYNYNNFLYMLVQSFNFNLNLILIKRKVKSDHATKSICMYISV